MPVTFICQSGEVVVAPKQVTISSNYYATQNDLGSATISIQNVGFGPLVSALFFPDQQRHFFAFEGYSFYNSVIKSKDYLLNPGESQLATIYGGCNSAGYIATDTAYLGTNDKDPEDISIPIQLTLRCGGEKLEVNKPVQQYRSSGCFTFYGSIGSSGTGSTQINYFVGCLTDQEVLTRVAAQLNLQGGEWRNNSYGYVYFITDIEAYQAGNPLI